MTISPPVIGAKIMILEEETFEKFGYYPGDLLPYSSKKIVVACDVCGKNRIANKGNYHPLCNSCANKGEKNPNWGKHHSDKTRNKISKANEGENHPFWGKHHTENSKERMSESTKGENHPFWGKHFSEETKEKIRKARKHRVFPKHHTKPERIFEEICKKNNLPFKYVGDGSFWIGNMNPDFVECNGKKIAVEIFGDYWHSRLLNWKLGEKSTLTYRKRALKKHGWKLAVFWESDLKRVDAEQFVLNILKKQGIM